MSQLEPGTHVILVRDGSASGTTIGYHGTLVRPLARSVFTSPDCPDSWSYRIYIPMLASEFDAPARSLVRFDRVDHIEPPGDVVCRIDFDSDPVRGESDVYGAYHQHGRGWVYFHFRKHAQLFDTFRLSMPTKFAKFPARCLVYNVRRDAELDATFLLRAIGSIVGFEVPSAKMET